MIPTKTSKEIAKLKDLSVACLCCDWHYESKDPYKVFKATIEHFLTHKKAWNNEQRKINKKLEERLGQIQEHTKNMIEEFSTTHAGYIGREGNIVFEDCGMKIIVFSYEEWKKFEELVRLLGQNCGKSRPKRRKKRNE